jgi:glyoxylase-like metal-dependent hydrolase (beta-lactamase superfamily II)
MSPTYAVFAVKYAERQARSGEHFLGGDPADVPMPMDYFVWAAVSEAHTVVVDTGFTAEVAQRRGRRHLRTPADGLRLIGVDPEQVAHVVLTHFHYDHVGTLDAFPAARFVVQEAEMAFWTGRVLSRQWFQRSVELADVQQLVRLNYEGRVRFVDGPDEVVPGVRVHRLVGHTGGLQVVEVDTQQGPIVLASDASHYYANYEQDRPFSSIADIGATFRAFDTLRSLSRHSGVLVPGHDPLVFERFPAAGPGLEGIAARLG